MGLNAVKARASSSRRWSMARRHGGRRTSPSGWRQRRRRRRAARIGTNVAVEGVDATGKIVRGDLDASSKVAKGGIGLSLGVIAGASPARITLGIGQNICTKNIVVY